MTSAPAQGQSAAAHRDDVRHCARPSRDGTIDVFATDHAPHDRDEKRSCSRAPVGFSGLEVAVGAYAAALPDLPLPRLIELISTNPARILGVPGGSLAVGARRRHGVRRPRLDRRRRGFHPRARTRRSTADASRAACSQRSSAARCAMARWSVQRERRTPGGAVSRRRHPFRRRRPGRRRDRAGRGRVLHRHDRLRRGADRSVVRRADSDVHLSADRQLRHLALRRSTGAPASPAPSSSTSPGIRRTSLATSICRRGSTNSRCRRSSASTRAR